MVEERAFKPYVYHTIAGAGTALESALRHADSRVLVGRPRSSVALRNACLDAFEGFGAGSGDASGLGRTGQGNSALAGAPGGSGLGNSSLGGSPLASAECGAGGVGGDGAGTRGRPSTATSPDVPARSSSGLFDVSTRTLMSGASSASRF